jgi:glycosyltransferase involved in cell wall biosynthesis
MSSFKPLDKLSSILATLPTALYRKTLRRVGAALPPELYYVAPGHNWVTNWVGWYITTHIQRQFGWRAHLTSTPAILSGEIVHYGEMGAFLHHIGSRHQRCNTLIATIFHGDRSEAFLARYPKLRRNVERFLENISILQRVVVSNRTMQARLAAWGVQAEKVACIPLGVDLERFKPATPAQRQALRQKWGIPDGAVCIGSFQKDGEGWGEGFSPKLIKGPDVFLQVIERLRRNYPLFVLLSGPARGYVKKGLESLGVPYQHEYLAHYWQVAALYHCLDVYLVTSREEGGPQAVLEALASGVPLVSTRVGMSPDVIQHGENGLLAEQEDAEALAEAVSRVIEGAELRQRLVANGLVSVRDYDWAKIAARYYAEVYRPVLSEPHEGGVL